MTNAVTISPTIFLVSIVLSGLSLVMLLYIVRVQLYQFRVKTELQPFKKLLLGLIISLVFANGLIFTASIALYDKPITSGILSSLSVVNRFIALATTVLLFMVYKYQLNKE